MAKFIKLDEYQILNIDDIILMFETKHHYTNEQYTKICLKHPPFTVKTKKTLEEVYKLIEDASKN